MRSRTIFSPSMIAITILALALIPLAGCGGGGGDGGSESATAAPATPAFLECDDCFQISRGIYGMPPADAFILTKRNKFQFASCSTQIQMLSSKSGKIIKTLLSQLWSHSTGLTRMIDLDAAVEKKETLAANDEVIASRGAGPASSLPFNALVDSLTVTWISNGCGPKSYAKADMSSTIHNYLLGTHVRVQRSDGVGVDIWMQVHDYPDRGGSFEEQHGFNVSNIGVDDYRDVPLAVGEEKSLPEYHILIKRESVLLYTFTII